MKANDFTTAITGFGHALPSYVVDNHYFERFLDTSDDWIKSRTGISTRYLALPALGETNTSLALQAVQGALDMAGVSLGEIDFIIGATTTPGEIMPTLACRVQAHLGLKDIFAFDLSAACSGFLFALGVADKFLSSGSHHCGLIVGSEILSSVTNYNDRSTCVLFGDGAGAAIVRRVKTHGHRRFVNWMGSDGSLAELLWLPAGQANIISSDPEYTGVNSKIVMKGNELFKVAVRCMRYAVEQCMERSRASVDQIDAFVPHQANIRIIDRLAEDLSFPKEKVLSIIDRIGNTSAASIPMTCSFGLQEGRLNSGDWVLSASFGGGLNYAACLYPILLGATV